MEAFDMKSIDKLMNILILFEDGDTLAVNRLIKDILFRVKDNIHIGNIVTDVSSHEYYEKFVPKKILKSEITVDRIEYLLEEQVKGLEEFKLTEKDNDIMRGFLVINNCVSMDIINNVPVFETLIHYGNDLGLFNVITYMTNFDEIRFDMSSKLRTGFDYIFILKHKNNINELYNNFGYVLGNISNFTDKLKQCKTNNSIMDNLTESQDNTSRCLWYRLPEKDAEFKLCHEMVWTISDKPDDTLHKE
jgi:hypothetical protein